jgi:hypothetical protein
MKSRAAILIWLGTVVLGLLNVAALAESADTPSPGPQRSVSEEKLAWQLSQAKVLRQGQLATNSGGITLTGYTLEAAAKAKAGAGNRLPEGKFVLTLNAFSSPTNRPGFMAGRWYVRGTWIITTKNTHPSAAHAESPQPHPDFIQGHLLADLECSPAAKPTQVNANVWTTDAPAWHKRVDYAGLFSGNGSFEGQLSLAVKRAPESGSPGAGATNAIAGAACPALSLKTTNDPHINPTKP